MTHFVFACSITSDPFFADAVQPQKYSVSITSASEVPVDHQVQITVDLTNNQKRDRPFAYLVQIQNKDGVTISLSWIAGSLEPGQSMNPSQSWTPTEIGRCNAQIFVRKVSIIQMRIYTDGNYNQCGRNYKHVKLL